MACSGEVDLSRNRGSAIARPVASLLLASTGAAAPFGQRQACVREIGCHAMVDVPLGANLAMVD